jgi:hypothetical protein
MLETGGDRDDAHAEFGRRLAAIEVHLTTVARQLDEISSSLATLVEHVSKREPPRDH